MAEIWYQFRFGLPVWFVLLILNWLPDIYPIIRLRGLLVSIFLPNRPRKLTLGRDLTFLSIHRLQIGDSVYIAKGAWINAIGGLVIEDEVLTAPYVVISTSNHGFKDGSAARGGSHPAPVVVGRGAWLAAHAVVVADVRIGRGNIVAANSVVTRDTPDHVIVGGVPGKVISNRIDNPSTIQSKYDI